MSYICTMKAFSWNTKKNKWLKLNRGIGFEDVVFLISEGNLIDIVKNPGEKYANQRIFILRFKDYIFLVPFVENEDEIFLKTIIPSRKATKKYLGGKT